MSTTPYAAVANTLITDVNFNTHTTAITELQYATGNMMGLQTAASSQSLATATWTALLLVGASPWYNTGSGLTASNTAITVTNAGLYECWTYVEFGNNTTGTRKVATSPYGTTPVSTSPVQTAPASTGTNRTNLISHFPIVASAGTALAPWGFQDSGGALTITSVSFFVKQIG